MVHRRRDRRSDEDTYIYIYIDIYRYIEGREREWRTINRERDARQAQARQGGRGAIDTQQCTLLYA